MSNKRADHLYGWCAPAGAIRCSMDTGMVHGPERGAVPVDTAAAVEAVRSGRTVRLIVGTSAEDPILHVWLENGGIMSEAVAGWSTGVVEPVCAAESPFLVEYLEDRHALEVIA